MLVVLDISMHVKRDHLLDHGGIGKHSDAVAGSSSARRRSEPLPFGVLRVRVRYFVRLHSVVARLPRL